MPHQDEQHPNSVPDNSVPDGDKLTEPMLEQLRSALSAAGASDDVLQLLDEPGTPTEILQRLVDAGVMPDEPASLEELIEEFEELLTPETSPLEAELAGAEFLAIARGDDDDNDQLAAVLTEVEQYGGASALGLLRVVAAISPSASIQQSATAAADRLAGTGLGDPPWVGKIGTPRPESCYGYVDSDQDQAVLATFRYGDETHALAVLIDGDLGGVRDVWVTDKPDELRDEFRADPDQFGAETELSAATAVGLLEQALTHEPCPVEEDEIDDVDIYLALLRQRLQLLAANAG
ncbi:hypothetical protein JQS43_04355 [Natronosporangium hydrolyticum]|uniref:Uncharacterized protein n=1 Tax=Natronosporangium hydrolyticum TaxID=2811111 RepID=A0A895YJ86_9ACTN|nr:hypothetical protein [Natronosporangium hydrolyticum]QSB15589.1 hypothetical protein JQS43_04355 [Natronosporangium hydrolyticum]